MYNHHMKKKYSVIFCGTPDFAVTSLRALAADDSFDIKLVVTQPDKPVGRKKTVTAPPVKVLAQSLDIPVLQPEKVNEELPAYLAEHPDDIPDFLVVVAYGKILSQQVLDLPRIAPVNVHGSVLPRWRGASPVEHAILNGDAETGVTIQVMVHELDAGPILSTAILPLTPVDTAMTVRQTLADIGAALLVETLKKPLKPKPQPSEGATFCRKLEKEDGVVDQAKMTAIDIDRRVRALNPWPGVSCEIEGHSVKLIETSLEPVSHGIPLGCAEETTLFVTLIQPPGKKPMKADDWRRGIH
jgi:methionyl-tRNA formyltransferase